MSSVWACKELCFGWLKQLKPPSVGRVQYHVGLVLMLLPLIPTYIVAYIPRWLPDQSALRLYVSLASDLSFLTGLFVAGGDMWDKIRALFVYDARVEFPGDAARPSTGDGESLAREPAGCQEG